MSQVFRKEQHEDYDGAGMYRPIRVVPSAYWLILVGAALIVAVIIAWLCLGWTVQTSDMSGIYHPGVVEEGEVICFPPLSVAKTIQPGMEVTAYVSSYNQQKYGHMKAVVSYVEPYVTSAAQVKMLLGDDLLVNSFLQNGPVAAVICKLQEDPSAENGYMWSNENGGSLVLQDGSYMSMSVAVSKQRPIALGLPVLYELFS